MTDSPKFYFFVPHQSRPVQPSDSIWKKPLPADRSGRIHGGSSSRSVTFGDYFNGIRNFFTVIFPVHAENILARYGIKASFDGIQEIHVCHEKHGALYHPARIDILAGNSRVSCVADVAISPVGRKAAHAEFQTLAGLQRKIKPEYLPEVFVLDTIFPGNIEMTIFLARWFSGFCEFHWTTAKPPERPVPALWEPPLGKRALTAARTAALFRQAAMILTRYYQPYTTERIFPWHHAAGDFIAKVHENNIAVRLISARGYTPLLDGTSRQDGQAPDPEQIIASLVTFFLQMSLQMRIDRIDGTGPLIFAPDDIVKPVCRGFEDGLIPMATRYDLPDDFPAWVMQFLGAHSRRRLIRELTTVFRPINVPEEERRLISLHIDEHAAALEAALR